jgi:hypothetical protein
MLTVEPLLSIQLFDHLPSHMPGDLLRCDYQIDAVGENEVQSIEASVLWYTEGKGDEDMGVHFFQRHVANDGIEDLRQLRSFTSKLPNSPLSYQGELLEIRWCVRLRAFLKRGRSVALDHPFWLGRPLRDDQEEPNAKSGAEANSAVES